MMIGWYFKRQIVVVSKKTRGICSSSQKQRQGHVNQNQMIQALSGAASVILATLLANLILSMNASLTGKLNFFFV
jgi:hypothetical protein